MKSVAVPNFAAVRSAGDAYAALPGGGVGGAAGPYSAKPTGSLRRKAVLCGAATFVVINLAGAIAALGMAFYVSSLASDIETAIHKVNTVYNPLLTAVGQIDNMYDWGARGAVWTMELLRAACGIPGFIPPELRSLLCGANGSAVA
jgi:hypothetical protein